MTHPIDKFKIGDQVVYLPTILPATFWTGERGVIYHLLDDTAIVYFEGGRVEYRVILYKDLVLLSNLADELTKRRLEEERKKPKSFLQRLFSW